MVRKMENKYWQGCGETGTLLCCWWECKMMQLLWKRVWWFLIKLNLRVTWWPSNATSRDILKWAENRCPNKNVYTNIPSSTIHNSQKAETMQMSITAWTDKQTVSYTYNVIWAVTKRNKILVHATTYMTLKNIMLNQRATHKPAYVVWSHLCERPRTDHLQKQKTENRLTVARD